MCEDAHDSFWRCFEVLLMGSGSGVAFGGSGPAVVIGMFSQR